jgi:hypothetical protein
MIGIRRRNENRRRALVVKIISREPHFIRNRIITVARTISN